MAGVDSCTVCGAEKYRNTSGKVYCKPCAARINREWREKNRSEVNDKQRARYERTKGQYLARCRVSYQANRDARDATSRNWRLANPEKVRAYKRAWVEKNPERGTAYAAKRRAIKMAAVCSHGERCVPFDMYSLVADQLCVYCAQPAEHADHFIPLARGGAHCRSNLVPACARCNKSKGSLLPDEWAARLHKESV